MKNYLVMLLLFCSFHVMGGNEKTVKSTVSKVTVFTRGAQVHRSAPVTLSGGVTQLIFSGLSTQIKPSSIQAGGKGAFVVLDVKHEIKYPEPPPPVVSELPKEIIREIALLEDSLTEIRFKSDDLRERRSALQLEKDMILKNKLARAEGKSDSLEVLIKAMDFFHKKLAELNTQLGKLSRDEMRNTKIQTLLSARLGELKTFKQSNEPEKKYEPIHQVIVTVSAEAPVSGTVDINYMVTEAGWIPSYDLRSTSPSEPVQLTYKADVYQNTGEDWDDVNLKLSTSNPNRSHIKPQLPTWYITYYTGLREVIVPGMARSKSPANMNTLSSKDEEALTDNIKKLSAAESSEKYAQLVETMTNVEFTIKLNYSIPSDGITHTVAVKSDKLPATYVHYLVPKLDSEAFLLARVTGWENLNLLPGKANLFYEGTYVGETVLNPSVINDTLDLALGRDNGITVTRTRLPVKEANKLLGSDITKTISWELRFKSNKSKPVHLIVEDQAPLSNIANIKVAMKDQGDASYNTTNGLLKWDFNLDPKAYKALKFTYEVTHNKDMPLSMY
ncbi:MAG: DUF4139 domain-containing protein [Bacteroidetes bacterium]|nr:DUF4139 domain-containing protein [Bacteroidota bacterium]